MGKYAINDMRAADVQTRLLYLDLIFSMVCDPLDWKAPIAAIVPNNERLREAIRDAVVHYTGTVPSFQYMPADSTMIVRAVGYREGPAGP